MTLPPSWMVRDHTNQVTIVDVRAAHYAGVRTLLLGRRDNVATELAWFEEDSTKVIEALPPGEEAS